ncbi:MAG: cysteine-rich CWC family protein [Burkholderiales bacterium]
MSPDPARCPLCGEQNACEMAAGSGKPCWCATLDFPAALLARVPAEARDKACICRACVEKATLRPLP